MGVLISFPPKALPAAPAGDKNPQAPGEPQNAAPSEILDPEPILDPKPILDFKPRPERGRHRFDLSAFLPFLKKAKRPVQSAPSRPRSLAFWIRSTQVLLLAAAVCFSMGASDAGSRVQNLDHRLMCTCGCAQLLGECNHVGCTESTQELAMLRTDVGSGMSDQQIFDAFSAKYGTTVLAAPPAQGFDLVAWIAPFAVFLAALIGTILLIRRWGGLRGFHPQPAGADDLSALDPAERDRRERIRRETDPGFDGGTSR